MTRQTKKDTELWALQSYLDAAGLMPSSIEAGERPDFLLTIDSATIGVEVTEYHVSGHRRDVDELWKQLRQTPRQRADFPKNRHVRFHFKNQRLPAKSEIAAFINEVSDLSVPDPGEGKTIVPASQQQPILSRYVDHLEVTTTKYQGPWSSNFDVGWIGATEEEMSSIAQAKANSTVRSASSYWLMITDGLHISNVMGFMDHTWVSDMSRLTAILEGGPFDRLILLQSPVIEWRRGDGWFDLPA